MLEEDPEIFKKMDRTLHDDYALLAGMGKKGQRLFKGQKKKKAKKKVFRARPVPPRPAPAELAKRAEQNAKKKAQPAAAAAQNKK